jgi:hypothetical protein
MKHILATILGGTLALFSPGLSHATDILSYTFLADDTAVASTAAVELPAFANASKGGIEAIYFVATSDAGTADLKIEWHGCIDAACTIEGTVADHTDLIASTNTTCPVSEGLCRVLIPVLGAPYVIFTVTGVGSNNADTTLDLYVTHRETVR